MLELNVFSGLLIKLEKYLNKKLTDEQTGIFWAKLKFIPYRALEEIITKMIDDLSVSSRFPEPKIFRQAWQDWKESNPDKIIRSKIKCGYCDNRGYLQCLEIPNEIRKNYKEMGEFKEPEFYWSNPKFIYKVVVNCGHCRSKVFAPRFVPEFTIDQIQGMIWLRIDPTRELPPGIMYQQKLLKEGE